MRQTTAKYELIQIRLGRPLDAYVAQRREAGDDWRTIATDITEISGVRISWETLRVWFPSTQSAASAVAEAGRVSVLAAGFLAAAAAALTAAVLVVHAWAPALAQLGQLTPPR